MSHNFQLQLGNSDFKSIRERDFYYVDKTLIIRTEKCFIFKEMVQGWLAQRVGNPRLKMMHQALINGDYKIFLNTLLILFENY